MFVSTLAPFGICALKCCCPCPQELLAPLFENQIGRAARSCPEEISPYGLSASAGRVFTWRFIAAFEQRACGSMGNYFPADRNETGDLRIEVSVA
jgi:hypothetical protein